MVIEKPGRGRPSRRYILEQVDIGMDDLRRIGGLPSPEDAAAIWRDIWYEEAHNSTAIEGNTLALKEVQALLDGGRSVGNKELREYLEVKAYAQAAEWVYAQGRTPSDWTMEGELLNLTEVRHVHQLTVGPVWELFPPDGLDPQERAGSFRRHDIAPFPSGMTPPPFTDVPQELSDWLRTLNAPPAGDHILLLLAASHGAFERIHPFRDGNGRVGRLLLNLTLLRRGYPPAVLRNRKRTAYLAALRRADAGDAWPLTELVARAVKESLDRFLLPNLAGGSQLLPLSAVGSSPAEVRALRAAAARGRLRVIREPGGRWMSTKEWVHSYRLTARVGRPRKEIIAT